MIIQEASKETYLRYLKQLFGAYEEHAERIAVACDFAIVAHAGQVRRYEGIPFVTHPMGVSLDLAERYQDVEMIIAGLLHDTVEDCADVSIEDIYRDRGEQVGYMVESVTEDPLFFLSNPAVVYRDRIEKFLAGSIQDVRVLLLKIADRDHNLITLHGLKPKKQIRMTFETQAIYEPLRRLLLPRDEVARLQQIEKRFVDYLKENSIQDAASLKKSLFDQAYHDFDHDMFQLAYNNTQAIVRQIEDKIWFEELLASKKFNDNVEILSLWTNGLDFKARFSFDAGYLAEHAKTGKYQLSNFMSQ